MLGIDTNILLHSLNPGSKDHDAAKKFLLDVFGDKSGTVVIADYVLVELYVLLRNSVVMSKPLSASRAVDLVTSYWKIPLVTRVENASIMDLVWKKARAENFARRRIFDVRLGETLRHHGVNEFATVNVQDFKSMGFEKVWNPLSKG